jgi:hypothetical protein
LCSAKKLDINFKVTSTNWDQGTINLIEKNLFMGQQLNVELVREFYKVNSQRIISHTQSNFTQEFRMRVKKETVPFSVMANNTVDVH